MVIDLISAEKMAFLASLRAATTATCPKKLGGYWNV